MTCLLCKAETEPPTDLAPTKRWWPPMTRCTNEDCIAHGVYVALDLDALERMAWENPDGTEPKFAYTQGGGDRWYVSTIYRRSSALDGRWYYETHAFAYVLGDRYRTVYEHGDGWQQGALRAHALFAKRLRRLADERHVDPDAGDLTNQYQGLTPA